MYKKLLLALGVASIATLLWAQPVGQNTVSGNECWNAGQGPGGPSSFLCINLVRHTIGQQVFGVTSGTINATSGTAVINLNGQPSSALTINTPPSPVSDGFNFQVCNTTNAAFVTQVITLAASTGQSLAAGTTTALTTLAAHTCEELLYQLSNTTWYQIR